MFMDKLKGVLQITSFDVNATRPFFRLFTVNHGAELRNPSVRFFDELTGVHLTVACLVADFEHQRAGVSGLPDRLRNIIKVARTVEREKMTVFIIYRRIVVDMGTDEPVAEQGHIVPSGREAEFMSAVPAESHTVPRKCFKCPCNIGKLALILEGNFHVFRICIFHQTSKAFPSDVGDGRRL